MLKDLQKKFGFGEKETMKDGKDAEVMAASFAALEVKVGEIETQLTSKIGELTAALAKVDELTAALATAEEAKAQAESLLKANKIAARKAVLSKEIGDEKATEVLAATETLDDDAFNKVVSAMVNAGKAEADTALFTEAGVEGKVKDLSKVQEETPEMKALKAKYKKTK